VKWSEKISEKAFFIRQRRAERRIWARSYGVFLAGYRDSKCDKPVLPITVYLQKVMGGRGVIGGP